MTHARQVQQCASCSCPGHPQVPSPCALQQLRLLHHQALPISADAPAEACPALVHAHHTQVHNLLASLNINPAELPADLAHVHDPRWHAAWQGPREGPLAADVAAAQREGWDAVWQQQQQQQPQPG